MYHDTPGALLCAHCGTRPVGRANALYCSRGCANRANHETKLLNRGRPAAERFWQYVAQGEGCWTWTGGKKPAGYGKFHVTGRMVAAHRFSWELHFGPVPDGLDVLHECDNPVCVRPDHLFLGTDADNVADCASKGRRAVGERMAIAVQNGRPGQRKLTEGQVREIRARFDAGETDRKRLAAEYGVCPGTIWAVARRKIWPRII